MKTNGEADSASLQQEKSQRLAKLNLIQTWIDEHGEVPLEDVRWLASQVRELDAQTTKQEEELAQERSARGRLLEIVRKAQNVLTLWLAFRGSADETIFKATAPLANQTTAVLNA